MLPTFYGGFAFSSIFGETNALFSGFGTVKLKNASKCSVRNIDRRNALRRLCGL
jgi:hypothetical protein